MRGLRRIIRWHGMGGLLAVSMAYVLVFQGLTGAFAQSLAAGSFPDPTHVICSAGANPGASSDPTDGSDGDQTHTFCAILCQYSGANTAVLLSVPTLVERSGLPRLLAIERRYSDPMGSHDRTLLAEARAPPFA